MRPRAYAAAVPPRPALLPAPTPPQTPTRSADSHASPDPHAGDPPPPDVAVAAAAALVLAAFAVFRFVPVPGLPCDVSPAKTCVTTDDAIALVPANAMAYLHVNLDRDSTSSRPPQRSRAGCRTSSRSQQGILTALGVAPELSLRDDLGSWIGDEAALAAVGRGGEPQPLALLAVEDEEGAKRFLDELGEGKPQRVENGGDSIPRLRQRPRVYAKLQGFLVFGSAPAVKAAIAVGKNERKALSDSEAGRCGPRLPARPAPRRPLHLRDGDRPVPGRSRGVGFAARHLRRLRRQQRYRCGAGRRGRQDSSCRSIRRSTQSR